MEHTCELVALSSSILRWMKVSDSIARLMQYRLVDTTYTMKETFSLKYVM